MPEVESIKEGKGALFLIRQDTLSRILPLKTPFSAKRLAPFAPKKIINNLPLPF